MVVVQNPVTLRLGDWNTLQTRLIWVYADRPGSPVSEHEASGLVAWRIDQGAVEVRNEAGVLRAHAGQWILPATTICHRTFTPDARIVSIHLEAVWPTGVRLFELPIPVAWDVGSTRQLDATAESLLAWVRRLVPDGRIDSLSLIEANPRQFFELRRLTTTWTQRLTDVLIKQGYTPTAFRQLDDRIARVIAWLDQRPMDEPWEDDAVCRVAGLRPSQLSRLFHLAINQTPHAYFEARRLAHARELLAVPTHSIKQISYTLGFKQPSHFTTWFRRHMGEPPKSYRR